MKTPPLPLRVLAVGLLAAVLLSSSVGCDRAPTPSVDTEGAILTDTVPATDPPAVSETPSEESSFEATDTPTEEPSVTDGEETDGTPAEPQADLLLVKSRASDYAIVYADGVSKNVLRTAEELRSSLISNYRLDGDSLPLRSDRDGTDAADGGFEILIGLTDRKESLAVAETLPPDSYTVTSMGNKLILLGTDDYRTAEAVTYFTDHFIHRYDSDLTFLHTSSIQEVIPMRGMELAENANIRIMSWNLQCPDGDAYDLFSNMVNGVIYYGADIIGLQECNAAAHKGVVECLSDYYAVATAYHEGTSVYDYTPILYNPERFELLESGVEWLDSRYTGTNTKCLSWAVLADRENGGQQLAVINFHGAVTSSKYAGMENMTATELNIRANEWKVDNVRQIRRKIAALEEAFGADLPVLVTGDYNTCFGDEPYRLMESYGYLDAEFNAVTSAMTGTKSTHEMGQLPVAGASIDHIFFSPNRGITAYVHTFGTRQSDLDATDHLPLIVDFAIGNS